jgi:hypothetical protein
MAKKKIAILVLSFLITGILCLPCDFVSAAGATLSFSPSSGNKYVGDTFNVNVVVNSGGGSGINASDAAISYDKDILTVKKVSKDSSIFNMWQTEPAFSNSAGTINYSGGKTPPAYTGSAGTIMSITFAALKVGTATVKFSAASALAADGKGTNVLSGTPSASFTITEKPKEEEKPAPVEEKPTTKPTEKPQETTSGILPPPPKVSSATHPKEDVWYSNDKPEFDWKLLADVSGVSLIIDQSSSSDPGIKSDGIIEQKKFENISDGQNYLHIKFQNKNGWGPITHRAVWVDITPPEEFPLYVDNGGDPTNPTPKAVFNPFDKTSGLEKYLIDLDGEKKEILALDYSKNPYEIPVLKPGHHVLTVAVFDKAGNSASSTEEFLVEALKAPVITEMPKVINKGDELAIQGTSFYPDAIIKIYIARDDDKEAKNAKVLETKTDPDGNWTYFQRNELEKGTYHIWAKVIDYRGAESYESMKKTLTVQAPSIICAYGWWIVIGLLVILILLIAAIIYQRRHFRSQKERAQRESRELEKRLNEIFAALKEEVSELIEMADKKAGFSDSEKRVKEKINEALDISQEFISKEIKDVEKEIE